MVARLEKTRLLAREEIVAPPIARSCDDHSFELPPVIYGAMAALFFGFLAVLAVGLAHPGLAVPMGVNFVFVAAFFVIPALFVRMAPEGSRALRWSQFLERGISIEHGRCSGREAATLVLMLPAFIFLWALAIVTIVALV